MVLSFGPACMSTNKLICKASDIIRVELDSLWVVSEKRVLSVLQSNMANVQRPIPERILPQ